MIWSTLEIQGFRGFAQKQSISLAVPNGTRGSGLTIVVGANNTGKSTITEALRVLGSNTEHSFSEGRRNKNAGDRVHLRISAVDGSSKTIDTAAVGGSETAISSVGDAHQFRVFGLPSRRYFNPYFGKHSLSRESYMAQEHLPTMRGLPTDRSPPRLFTIQDNKAAFDEVLRKVVSPVPDWKIDMAENGQYYLKIDVGGLFHSSEGMGEGLVSLMLIVDALYDSVAGDVIVIDEPELSLHPAFQRKLAALLNEYAKSRQIVCATHSPYFVNFEAFSNGGEIYRTFRKNAGCEIARLGGGVRKKLKGFLKDLCNPHLLGLDAREVFFLEDNIVLVEGQEDAVIYPRIAEQLDINLTGDFFGWGVGGADNMNFVAGILSDLQYEKVFGILDANKAGLIPKLEKEFPKFEFMAISAEDVRSKPPVKAKSEVKGLTNDVGRLIDEHVNSAKAVLTAVNRYFSTTGSDKQIALLDTASTKRRRPRNRS